MQKRVAESSEYPKLFRYAGDKCVVVSDVSEFERDGNTFYEYTENVMSKTEYEEYQNQLQMAKNEENAEILLNQMNIIDTQAGQDETLADILLSIEGGSEE